MARENPFCSEKIHPKTREHKGYNMFTGTRLMCIYIELFPGPRNTSERAPAIGFLRRVWVKPRKGRGGSAMGMFPLQPPGEGCWLPQWKHPACYRGTVEGKERTLEAFPQMAHSIFYTFRCPFVMQRIGKPNIYITDLFTNYLTHAENGVGWYSICPTADIVLPYLYIMYTKLPFYFFKNVYANLHFGSLSTYSRRRVLKSEY